MEQLKIEEVCTQLNLLIYNVHLNCPLLRHYVRRGIARNVRGIRNECLEMVAVTFMVSSPPESTMWGIFAISILSQFSQSECTAEPTLAKLTPLPLQCQPVQHRMH